MTEPVVVAFVESAYPRFLYPMQVSLLLGDMYVADNKEAWINGDTDFFINIVALWLVHVSGYAASFQNRKDQLKNYLNGILLFGFR